MRKALWWILGILLSPVLLFVILTILIYLPPVQNWVVDKVAEYASEQTGMDITVDHVDLSFPIDLGVDGVKVIHHPDTIADVERMVVDVQLLPLFGSKVVINQLEVNNTSLNTNGFVEAARVKGRFGRLFVKSDGIDLKRETVEVNGARLEDAQLDIALNDSVPEDTTKSEAKWQIHVDVAKIRRSDIVLHMPGDTMSVRTHFGTLAVREAFVDLASQTYTVASVDWENGALQYDQNFQPRIEGLDFNHLDFTNINIGIDSIYYHDPALRLQMRSVALREKNGLQVKVGRQDVLQFMGGMPQAFRDHWPNQPLTLKGALNGNMQHMEFSDLDITLPTAFHATATGFAENMDDPKKLRADVQFQAQAQNIDFVRTLMGAAGKDYRIPPLSVQGRVKADGANYVADVSASEGKGTVKLKGRLNADAMRYDAQLSINNLNVHHFMPRDSIYTVTADVNVKGQGTDFLSPRTILTADAKIQHLRYGHWNFDNVTALAEVKNGHAIVDMDSRNSLLNGKLNVDALLNTRNLTATVTTDLNAIDLYKMGLVDRPLSIGLCGHVDVTSDMKLSHYVSGLISDITVRDSSKTLSSEFVGLHVKTSPDTTILRAQSGDSASSQFSKKIIDQASLRQLLPTMKIHVESQRENPLLVILKSQGVDFKTLLFDMTTSPETGINGNGYVHSLNVSNVRLDTINFRLTQRKERLSFGGQICNNKKNPQFVFNALFDGVLQERGATFGVRYYDAVGKMGARIGSQVEMLDSGLNFRLVPERPTLGYKEFNLNADNYLFLGTNRKVKAHIDLVADDGMGMKIYSEDTDPTALQDITVSLNKFNLDEVTSVIPYAPRMTGLLNGDYHVVQNAEGHLSVASDMAVHNMTYERSPIGNVSTELLYLQKSDSAHAVEARLMKDEVEIGLLSGTYYNIGEGSLDAKLQLKRLPLSMVNGFIEDQIFGLQGYGDGELEVKGSLSKPQVNGEIYLDSSYVESVPYGVTLRFDNDPVRIVDSKLMFDNFTMYAHNENPLNIQGYVDFADLDRMSVDMRIRAKNFQLIGAKENPKSVAYGKAFVNVFASIRGPMDNMNMRGRLEVLGTTDMGYILRDSPLTTDNHLDNLVKFKDFSDTTQVVVSRPSLSGFTMDMTLEVSNGAHIMAYLNADHSNYIDLMGGGTLRMSYSPADNLRLTEVLVARHSAEDVYHPEWFLY